MTDVRCGGTGTVLRCGWCGAYDGTVDPNEPCDATAEIDRYGHVEPTGPHQIEQDDHCPGCPDCQPAAPEYGPNEYEVVSEETIVHFFGIPRDDIRWPHHGPKWHALYQVPKDCCDAARKAARNV